MGGVAFCSVTATTGTKFAILRSIAFLHVDKLGVSHDGYEKVFPCSLRRRSHRESFTLCTHI